MEIPGGPKCAGDLSGGFRISGVRKQPTQLGNYFHNAAMGMDNAAVLGTNGLDRFRYQSPRFIRRLGQIAALQMLPGAAAKILGHSGVLTGRTGCVQLRVRPVIGAAQSPGHRGGNVRVRIRGDSVGCGHRKSLATGWYPVEGNLTILRRRPVCCHPAAGSRQNRAYSRSDNSSHPISPSITMSSERSSS